MSLNQTIEDFSTSLLSANSEKNAKRVTEKLFAHLGFDGVFYGVANERSGEVEHWTTHALKKWSCAYSEEHDYQYDPLFLHMPRMPAMFNTGASFISDYPYLGQKDRNVILRAEAFGLVSGVAISMPFDSPGEHGGWNILSSMSRCEFTKLQQNKSDIMCLAATLAHVKISEFRTRSAHNLPQLTPRERECLLWLANGLRTNQIAWKMNIKPVTVDLHIRSARRRLNAKTREQALAIAINFQLIDP